MKCTMWNVYFQRKWTRRPKIKLWARIFEILIVLLPLGMS